MLQYWPLSFKGFVFACIFSLLCALPRLPPRRAGSNCLVFVWLQVTVGPWFESAKTFQQRPAKSRWSSGDGVKEAGGGWANDVKATPDNQSEQWLVLMAGGCLVLGWLMLAWASIQSPAMWTPLCKHCHCGESLSSLKPRSVASFVICSRDQKEGGEGSQDWGSHV